MKRTTPDPSRTFASQSGLKTSVSRRASCRASHRRMLLGGSFDSIPENVIHILVVLLPQVHTMRLPRRVEDEAPEIETSRALPSHLSTHCCPTRLNPSGLPAAVPEKNKRLIWVTPL